MVSRKALLCYVCMISDDPCLLPIKLKCLPYLETPIIPIVLV
jgi:hypothetical protein